MSDQKQPPITVPEGRTRFLTTRQLPASDKGFIGYETVWEPFQKEAEYKTPKQP